MREPLGLGGLRAAGREALGACFPTMYGVVEMGLGRALTGTSDAAPIP
jgi:hypothetical protein